GMQAVRGSLPSEEQERSETQSDQHARPGSVAEAGKRELGVFPVAAGIQPQQALAHPGEGFAVARAAVRVFGRLRGLRRNAIHQAADAALWRPPADRECDGLLLDLWRKPADHTVHPE